MGMRHEWKHEINHADLRLLRQRLRAVMQTDPNGVQGKYEVRSLYFDNAADRVLLEKVYGIKCREKFRIRYYNSIHPEYCWKKRVNTMALAQSRARF